MSDDVYDFDLEQATDDIQDIPHKELIKLLSPVAEIILFLFSAASSVGFFYFYAGDVWSWISPTLSPFISGFLGAFAFEGMSFVWRQRKAKHANTQSQIDLATLGANLTLGGGIAVTIVFLALNTSLLRGVLDETAMLVTNVIGGFLIIAGVSGNFLLHHLYSNRSKDYTEAAQRTKLTAQKNAALFDLMNKHQKQVIKHTKKKIEEQIPDVSKSLAEAIAKQFVQQQSTNVNSYASDSNPAPANMKKDKKNSGSAKSDPVAKIPYTSGGNGADPN